MDDILIERIESLLALKEEQNTPGPMDKEVYANYTRVLNEFSKWATKYSCYETLFKVSGYLEDLICPK